MDRVGHTISLNINDSHSLLESSSDVSKLFQAIGTKNKGLLERLLKEGVNVHCMGPDGITPLFAASFMKNYSAVKLLFRYGASPNVRCTDGATAVHGAAYSGSQRILRLILSMGGSLNLHSDEGKLPRDWADLVRDPEDRRRMHKIMETFEMDSVESCQEKLQESTLKLAELSVQCGGNPPAELDIGPGLHLMCGGSKLFMFLNLSIAPESLVLVESDPYKVGAFTEMVFCSWGETPVMVRRTVGSSGQRHPQPDLMFMELDSLRYLRHPDILTLIGVSWKRNNRGARVFPVFEAANLRSVHHFLHVRRSVLRKCDVEDVGRQLVSALAYLHMRGLVHGAITSHAVQLVSQNRGKLSCFEYMSDERTPVTEVMWKRSAIGNQVALHRWIAPEVVGKRALMSLQSDVYSLCVVVEEMMRGRLPWAAVSDEYVSSVLAEYRKGDSNRNLNYEFPGLLLDALVSEDKPQNLLKRVNVKDLPDIIAEMLNGHDVLTTERIYDSVHVTSSSESSHIAKNYDSLKKCKKYRAGRLNQSRDSEPSRLNETSLLTDKTDGKANVKNKMTTSELFMSMLASSPPSKRRSRATPLSRTPSNECENADEGYDEREAVVQLGSVTQMVQVSREDGAVVVKTVVGGSQTEAVKPASHFSTRHGDSCSLQMPHVIGTATGGNCVRALGDTSLDETKPGSLGHSSWFAKLGKPEFRGPYAVLPEDIVRAVAPSEPFQYCNGFQSQDSSFTRRVIHHASVRHSIGNEVQERLLEKLRNGIGDGSSSSSAPSEEGNTRSCNLSVTAMVHHNAQKSSGEDESPLKKVAFASRAGSEKHWKSCARKLQVGPNVRKGKYLPNAEWFAGKGSVQNLVSYFEASNDGCDGQNKTSAETTQCSEDFVWGANGVPRSTPKKLFEVEEDGCYGGQHLGVSRSEPICVMTKSTGKKEEVYSTVCKASKTAKKSIDEAKAALRQARSEFFSAELAAGRAAASRNCDEIEGKFSSCPPSFNNLSTRNVLLCSVLAADATWNSHLKEGGDSGVAKRSILKSPGLVGKVVERDEDTMWETCGESSSSEEEKEEGEDNGELVHATLRELVDSSDACFSELQQSVVDDAVNPREEEEGSVTRHILVPNVNLGDDERELKHIDDDD
ncbi:unnamed protein product [Notodromas monacha]|uniref:Protein kinase domain-containing protein n=1 Tax=Notodromas monacha TaxID=399045 RepID=A0A7R9GAG3_9CRUS|nr:unnamed protein product [Notodromas monacha]CAG0913672.1 unnamed protein product [Notodromas monacha]